MNMLSTSILPRVLLLRLLARAIYNTSLTRLSSSLVPTMATLLHSVYKLNLLYAQQGAMPWLALTHHLPPHYQRLAQDSRMAPGAPTPRRQRSRQNEDDKTTHWNICQLCETSRFVDRQKTKWLLTMEASILTDSNVPKTPM
ncbi:hypothetical protein GGS20DRAFT_369122 [Poronia punctata]|nr:hypothetical protein GGS20DRAFT_369122 [Poronia punctata]